MVKSVALIKPIENKMRQSKIRAKRLLLCEHKITSYSALFSTVLGIPNKTDSATRTAWLLQYCKIEQGKRVVKSMRIYFRFYPQ